MLIILQYLITKSRISTFLTGNNTKIYKILQDFQSLSVKWDQTCKKIHLGNVVYHPAIVVPAHVTHDKIRIFTFWHFCMQKDTFHGSAWASSMLANVSLPGCVSPESNPAEPFFSRPAAAATRVKQIIHHFYFNPPRPCRCSGLTLIDAGFFSPGKRGSGNIT